jgi:hypothetical protein
VTGEQIRMPPGVCPRQSRRGDQSLGFGSNLHVHSTSGQTRTRGSPESLNLRKMKIE